MLTRRDFGKMAAAALPLSRALAAINSKINGVEIGVQTYSFRSLPHDQVVDGTIKAMVDIGLGICELFCSQIEPARVSRDELRNWRLTTPLDYFKDVHKKFDDAGINIFAYNYSFNESFTDEEIDRGFEMANAVGAKVITASTTLLTVRRVIPFADKHKMIVAMHGHSDKDDPNQFCTPQSFQAAMEMSKLFYVNLDIGHFFAAGFDPVAFIKKHHARITNIHLKDRKKDDGANVPWGEGDTPIKPVLALLRDSKFPIPALIEYEYRGTGTPEEEVKKCFEYCKQALA